MIIEMFQPQQVILEEIADKRVTQRSVVLTYGFVIRQEHKTADWPRINRAITERWKGKTALERIKQMAWESLS